MPPQPEQPPQDDCACTLTGSDPNPSFNQACEVTPDTDPKREYVYHDANTKIVPILNEYGHVCGYDYSGNVDSFVTDGHTGFDTNTGTAVATTKAEQVNDVMID